MNEAELEASQAAIAGEVDDMENAMEGVDSEEE